jgi:MSHA biogenesis protein MshO
MRRIVEAKVSHRLLPRTCGARGFTLVELVIVILVLGVLAGSVAVFINNPVRSYFESLRRAQLADAADTATRRIARDLQGAVPNSVRIATNGTTVLLEFTPIADTGRYRAATAGGTEPGGTDPLDLSDPLDSSFQVLGSAVAVPAAAQLVVYNLGSGDLDLYAGSNRRPVTTAPGSAQSIAFTPTMLWPVDSPNERFFLVNGPVTYACMPAAGGSGRIERFAGYAFAAIQPTSTTTGALAAADRSLLVDRVVACSFELNASLANANGVSLSIGLGDADESVRLYTQIHLPNTP